MSQFNNTSAAAGSNGLIIHVTDTTVNTVALLAQAGAADLFAVRANGVVIVGSDADYYSGSTFYISQNSALLTISNPSNDSGGAQIVLRSKGTAGSGVTASGDWLGFIGTRGYYTGAWEGSSVTAIYSVATESHTNAHQGTRLDFDVTAIGANFRAVKMSITSVGLGIGIVAPKSALHVVGLATYANNAAAVAAGLSAGAFYRNNGDPDLVCVVH
jgi:hypothetical protein